MTKVFVCLVGLSCASARAQPPGDAVSVGVGFSAVGLRGDRGLTPTDGLSGWASFNLARTLAIETRVAWHPRHEPQRIESQGGQTFTLVAGPRVTLISTKHVSIQGVIQPGIIRFSNTLRGGSNGALTSGARTHFVLDLGWGVEFLPRARWSPRLDFLQKLYVIPDTVLDRVAGNGNAVLQISSPGEVAETYQVLAGVTYRRPRFWPTSPASPAKRFSVGMQAGHVSGVRVLEGTPRHDFGLGGFGSLALARNIHLDGHVTVFPAYVSVHTPWEGGRTVQALGGIRVGRRAGRLGTYAKARAGLVSNSAVFQREDSEVGSNAYGRAFLPAFDAGGILEIDTTPRSFLRVEAGDLLTLYRERVLVIDGQRSTQPAQPPRHSIQFAFGAGWRF